jgi:hypothetical protein
LVSVFLAIFVLFVFFIIIINPFRILFSGDSVWFYLLLRVGYLVVAYHADRRNVLCALVAVLHGILVRLRVCVPFSIEPDAI